MILCCGEALIDFVEVKAVGLGGDAFAPHPGGAIFNTAIALGRLNVGVGFLSGISTDMFGMQIRQSLSASNVDTSHVISSDRPTTLAFVKLTNGHAAYTFYDENSAGRMLDPENLPRLSDKVSTLYFGGISLVSEPCADFYAGLAQRESAKRLIVCDPNIRPGFITDAENYRRRLDQMIRHSDILKVSDEDLNWIIPEPMSLAQKANLICKMGPKIVVLTLGSKGAQAYLLNGQIVTAHATAVDVVDTVGAGDTFNAGVMAQLSESGLLTKRNIGQVSAEQIEAALAHGGKVAAITVSRSGANPPWADEL